MKDWEISETYVLPRILYLREVNNAIPGKQPKPNLRYFSLNEDCSEWTTWKRSDYFYPEMIPEPDYSDSGDDAGSDEDDEGYGPYSPETRSTIERLRELTEVYVSNVDVKRAPAQPKKAASKQVGTSSKSDQKLTKVASKGEPVKNVKPTGKAPQAKRSPSPTRKAPVKAGTKTSELSKTPVKSSRSTTSGRDESPKTSPKSPPRTKRTPSAEKKASPAVSKTKPKAPPPVPAKGKDSPKAVPKVKAVRKEKIVARKATLASDERIETKETSAVSRKSPPSSPSSTKSKSPVSSEQSSDDEQLIKPRKAVPPHLQSTERQQLHKELKFSQKYGKLGASSKTELQVALERYTENKIKRELNAEDKTSLEKILEFQAKKIEMQEIMDKAPAWVERLQKPPATVDPKTDEFYRVHARVVTSNALTHCFLSDDERSECSSSRKMNSDSGSDS